MQLPVNGMENLPLCDFSATNVMLSARRFLMFDRLQTARVTTQKILDPMAGAVSCAWSMAREDAIHLLRPLRA
jgi:hypothetical protein